MTRQQDLNDLLEQLPQEQRACLGLHFQGYRATTIAEIVEIPESSVYQHITRGIARLRALLKDDGRQFQSLLTDNS